eukprot:5149759-Prorocentrum_lima.AAC.1
MCIRDRGATGSEASPDSADPRPHAPEEEAELDDAEVEEIFTALEIARAAWGVEGGAEESLFK